jgi:hypothetical protein
MRLFMARCSWREHKGARATTFVGLHGGGRIERAVRVSGASVLLVHTCGCRKGWSVPPGVCMKVGSSSEGTANMEKKERQAAQSTGLPLTVHVGADYVDNLTQNSST